VRMSIGRAVVPFVLFLSSIGCGSPGSKSTGAGARREPPVNDASADTSDADATQDATVAEASAADAIDARGDTATAEDRCSRVGAQRKKVRTRCLLP
jgi:hypothetical protein